MTDLQKKLLKKDFDKIDISNMREDLLAILKANPSLIQSEVYAEYHIYEAKQVKILAAKVKKEKKTDEVIKKFKILYPQEKVSLFRDLIDEFETIYPLDMPSTFKTIAKQSKGLKYDDIVDLFYNYEYQDLKTACKSYRVKYKTLNTSITRILQELINQTKNNISHYTPRSDISSIFQYVTDIDAVKENAEEYSKLHNKLTDIQKEDYGILQDIKNMDNLIKKSLNYLRCFGIAYFEKTGKYTKYEIKLSDWFEDRRYSIANKELLKMLMPLMVEYIKSSQKINVNSFFEKIDSVLEYVLQPFENHNENFELEKYFLENIDKEVSTRMVDHLGSKNKLTITMDKVEIHNKIITIRPIRIVFGEDEKYLEYSDKNEEIDTVLLSDIVRVQVYDTSIINNIIKEITQDFSCVNAYITDKDEDEKDQYYICNPKYLEAFKDKVSIEDKLYTIILELPLTALEFFKIQPLNNMKIYARADEIVEFGNIIETDEIKAMITGEFKIKDSHFYVIANDTLNNATAIVLDTLSDITIVTPNNLHKKIYSILNKYSSNSRL